MGKPKVYVTRQIVPPWLDYLKEICDVELNPLEDAPPRKVLLEKVKDKDALLCMLTDKIDAELFDAAPNLVVVGTHSVGFEHIDVPEATRRGIYVTYTPGVLTDATADFTWALILASARRLAEGDRYVRAGKWKVGWAPTMFLGAKVSGRTLGIIGLGRIGQAVAKRAKGFDMRILYYDVIRARPEVEKETGATFVPLEQLLKDSDFISLHVPVTKETRHMINEKTLKMMKPTAFLINTSRGAVVDEAALARAIEEKWIAGAGLDVFEKEPLPMDSPLLKFENVTLAPHIASADIDSRSKMSELVVKDIIAVLKGEMPKALVNPEVQKVRSLSQVRRI
ncbi:MAG: glyoxylate reductase [Candidatus Bathyarchaeia archaeon]